VSEQAIHKNLAAGRWSELSFAQQLGNIGSEISRARLAKERDAAKFWGAVVRGQELFFLTFADRNRTASQKKELCRAYEVFCDAVLGGKVYGSDLESLDRYFMNFALLAMHR
jgi:hypothetical protein